MADRDRTVPDSAGILRSATEAFLGSTRSLVEQIKQAGGAGAQAVVPAAMLASTGHMLRAMRTAVEEAPQIGAELEIVLGEIRAKRLTIQAVAAELTVLDAQLDVLERALAPVEAWNEQWSRVQHSLLHSLDLPDAPPG